MVFAQSLFDEKKLYVHQSPNIQLMSAVVSLKRLVKVPLLFVSNKDHANTVLDINEF